MAIMLKQDGTISEKAKTWSGLPGDCSYSFGFLIDKAPFIQTDKGLIFCTDLSIRDNIAGVYVGAHLYIHYEAESLLLFMNNMEQLEDIFEEYGSMIEDREAGLIFGKVHESSQHKNIYEYLKRKGYNIIYVYQSKGVDEEYYINHWTGEKRAGKDIIPNIIDKKALVNSTKAEELDDILVRCPKKP